MECEYTSIPLLSPGSISSRSTQSGPKAASTSGTMGRSGSRRFRASATAAWPAYTSAKAPVGQPDDQHGGEGSDEELRGMQPPAVSRREDLDQPFDRRHSGVRCRPAEPLRAALSQRGTRRELRAAAPAQRVDANALGGHFAQDRPFHRYEERQRGNRRPDRRTAETAPSSPRPHTADELTKGLHGSIAPTIASALDAPAVRLALLRALRARDMRTNARAREVSLSRIPSVLAPHASSRARGCGICPLPPPTPHPLRPYRRAAPRRARGSARARSPSTPPAPSCSRCIPIRRCCTAPRRAPRWPAD